MPPSVLLVMFGFEPCLVASSSWAPIAVLPDRRVRYKQVTVSLLAKKAFRGFWLFSWTAVRFTTPLQLENWGAPWLSASLLQDCLRFKPPPLDRVWTFSSIALRHLFPLGKSWAGFELSLFGKLKLDAWFLLEGEVDEGVLGDVCLVTGLTLQFAFRCGCDVLFRNANEKKRKECYII